MLKRIIYLSLLLAFYLSVSGQSPAEGAAHYYNQRYIAAEDYFHRSLAQRPDDASAWYWLTRSYLQQDQVKEAADSLQLAPASLRDNEWLLVAKGALLLAQNNTSEANTLFNQAMDMTKSKDADILGAIADVMIESPDGDPHQALAILDKTIKRDKRNPKWEELKGNAYRNLHDGTEAYKAYMEAIHKDDTYAAAYYRLGKLFQSQKNTDLYLENFEKAVQADPRYAPAYYELYYYYMYTDPMKGMVYFNKYSPLADKTTQLEYTYTDLLYLTKEYPQAIGHARQLLLQEGNNVQPRLYKLIAYSQKELKDTMAAIHSMQEYFSREHDSNYVVKDFETMALLQMNGPAGTDTAIHYLGKAVELSTDSTERLSYYAQLANLTESRKDYAAQAKWLGRLVNATKNVSNVDLFNWGIAGYRAGNYVDADSVFARYTREYPEQPHGYYWRARSNAAIDTSMVLGLAIPHYEKMLEMAANDSTTSAVRTFRINAYAYLAAYSTNVKKDYATAIGYFEKMLEIDPANAQAKKYIDILRKQEGKEEGSN
jgi:tetratricopeptide (TPR) repeat protein